MAALTLFEKLKQVESRYEEMTAQLSSPEVLADSARIQKLAKMHSEMSEIVKKYREWKKFDQAMREAKQMAVNAEDADMRQMAHDEEKTARAADGRSWKNELKLLLLPQDPNDDKTSSSKFAPAQAAKKQRFSRANYSGCIRDMRKRSDGRWKCSRARPLRSAA